MTCPPRPLARPPVVEYKAPDADRIAAAAGSAPRRLVCR
jgi:hypothetical protein